MIDWLFNWIYPNSVHKYLDSWSPISTRERIDILTTFCKKDLHRIVKVFFCPYFPFFIQSLAPKYPVNKVVSRRLNFALTLHETLDTNPSLAIVLKSILHAGIKTEGFLRKFIFSTVSGKPHPPQTSGNGWFYSNLPTVRQAISCSNSSYSMERIGV